QLAELPRLADFAITGEAVGRLLGYPDGFFVESFSQNRQELIAVELSNDPVAVAVQQFIEDPARMGQWSGSPTALFRELDRIVGPAVTRSKLWPGAASHLSTRLRRLAPSLRTIGIGVDQRRTGAAGRLVTLTRASKRSGNGDTGDTGVTEGT